jgi:hypothetical protein
MIQNTITSDQWRSPYFLSHLIIEIKIKFLLHFYSRKYEMKLESSNGPHPSKVLFIRPSKIINDYNALESIRKKTAKLG